VKSIGTPANGISPGTFNLIILRDTDHDGIPTMEIANGFSPTNAGTVSSTRTAMA